METTGVHARGPTRREFIRTSTALLLGSGAFEVLQPIATHRIRLLYVGTYTDDKRAEGIHLARFDTRTGALELLRSFDAGPNPSFLAVDPHKRFLYAVNEVEERGGRKNTGAVTAFAIDRDTGALARLNERPSDGAAPCYVSITSDGRSALVANYTGGSVALFPIASDGELMPAMRVVGHSGHGPRADRQEAPHAHCIVPDRRSHFALAADLGADRVIVYRLGDRRAPLERVSDVAMRPGAGPRHIAIHPTLSFAFVSNELDSTVTMLRLDRRHGELTAIDTRSTLPPGWSGENYVADIHLDARGDTLYVSNRGHNSIARFAFSRDNAALSFQDTTSTRGDWPRNFTLDPTERWLLVANQRSGSITVFQRGVAGALNPVDSELRVASPVCLTFLD